MAKATDLDKTLSELFDAERQVRKLHDAISDAPAESVLDAVERALRAALEQRDPEESALRLERVAMILGELEGPRAVDLLIDVLGAPEPDVRTIAGEQLEGLAFDRFKEVARGVERALKRLPTGSPALPELPYILAEVPEPGVLKLLELFLKHEDPDAVAAAIEVGVEIGDPAILRHLEPLKDDKRVVEMSDENDESTEITLAELVADALSIFEGADEAFDDAAAPAKPSPGGAAASKGSPAKGGKKG
jgi:HEAT repeat protein